MGRRHRQGNDVAIVKGGTTGDDNAVCGAVDQQTLLRTRNALTRSVGLTVGKPAYCRLKVRFARQASLNFDDPHGWQTPLQRRNTLQIAQPSLSYNLLDAPTNRRPISIFVT